MITYRFEAKCETCGKKKVAAGVVVTGNAMVKSWNTFFDALSRLRWRVESKNGAGVLKCPECMAKRLKRPQD